MSGLPAGRPTMPAAALTTRPPRVRVLNRKHDSAAVVYQLTAGRHRQLGVIVELAIDDYRSGRIRRHEATHPDPVRRLAEMWETSALAHMPVTLFHRSMPRLRALLCQTATGEPDGRLVSGEGGSEAAWLLPDGAVARAIQAELAELDVLYIADGHHRMSAAADYFAGHAGVAPFMPAALFPADEMRVLGYHRCLARPAPESETLETLAALPATAWLTESAVPVEPAPGIVGVHLDGRWYRLGLRTPPAAADPRASLDLVALENGILSPMLGGADVASDVRITAVPGTEDTASLARYCAERDTIGFLLHPPDIRQIMAVADAGLVMPPKSTWFDPKPSSGLLHG